MKLKLLNDKDVAVLEITETVQVANISILKAGLVQLLKTGKKKVLIDLTFAKTMSVEVAAEVVKLTSVATTHQGQLVLVGQTDVLRVALKSLDLSIQVKTALGRENGIRLLASPIESKSSASPPTSPEPAASAPPPPIVMPEFPKITKTQVYFDPPDSITEIQNRIQHLEAENKTLREMLQQQGVFREVKRLFSENAINERQVALMQEELRGLVKDRKKPFYLESFNQKLAQLLTVVEQFIAAHSAGAPGNGGNNGGNYW